jgi:hypothetical protein
MTSTKTKGKEEVGPSTKTNSTTSNTRNLVTHTQACGSNIVLKRPWRTTTMPRENVQRDANKGDTSQANEEGTQAMTSGEHTSQKKRTTT